MGLKLQDAVVIVDEAHNTEDVCRSVASHDFALTDLRTAAEEVSRMAGLALPGCAELYVPLAEVLRGTIGWMSEVAAGGRDAVELAWAGREAAQKLDQHVGINAGNIAALRELFQKCGAKETGEGEGAKPGGETALAGGTLKLLEMLLCVCDFFVGDGGRNIDAYRLVLRTEEVFVQQQQRGRNQRTASHSELMLCFWCLDPAVAFRAISSQARALILTSGTLTPMDSFASELGTVFHNRLEAPHVIQPEQVWVGCIPRSLSGARRRSPPHLPSPLRRLNRAPHAHRHLAERHLPQRRLAGLPGRGGRHRASVLPARAGGRALLLPVLLAHGPRHPALEGHAAVEATGGAQGYHGGAAVSARCLRAPVFHVAARVAGGAATALSTR
jgi:hypothetical protein